MQGKINILKKLIASGVHIGKKTNKWNPKTSIYLFGQRKTNTLQKGTEANILTKTKGINIHIIDLEQTILMLRRAITFIQKISKNRGIILYVPSKLENPLGLSLNQRDGTSQIENAIHSLNVGNKTIETTYKIYEDDRRNGLLKDANIGEKLKNSANGLLKITKGTQNIHSSSIKLLLQQNKLNKDKRGLKASSFSSSNIRDTIFEINKQRNEKFHIPQALFITNTTEHKTLIREAVKLRIPIIGIVDSNASTYGIEFPIPGNTDSMDSQEIYTQMMFYAIADGKKKEILFLQQNAEALNSRKN